MLAGAAAAVAAHRDGGTRSLSLARAAAASADRRTSRHVSLSDGDTKAGSQGLWDSVQDMRTVEVEREIRALEQTRQDLLQDLNDERGGAGGGKGWNEAPFERRNVVM